jgi:hypothetical protein
MKRSASTIGSSMAVMYDKLLSEEELNRVKDRF